MRTTITALALVLSGSALAACSTEAQMRAEDPAAHSTGAASTEPAEPAEADAVRTADLATVLDDGDGAELCLGGVAESLPPQCSGLPMAGWDWAEHPEHEEAAGVRWGSFAVTGSYDGETFTVTEAVPAALYDPMAQEPEEPLGTPCEEVGDAIDASRATPEAMDATLNAAAALPDVAMVWLDEDLINVAVTEDPARAEAKLRETWGGLLCVSTAEHTQRELEAIQQELNELPGLLSSGSTRPDHIGVTVVHDDGSIQEQVDEEYGEGLVEVSSALVSAEG
ncbi:hypothetical protein EXE58_12165 [Nocardioides seonyuensis]|uniref:Secreted protein n=1 Tax=Nocardioides seonyuensis TaxID=2518371 RepID=A0A4P7IFU9_9ACTN|nr:hypothetical protein [Nocardioides seonyuensis]QBX56145.1 hypothetical protein EXE58_12165 [Nocardioides seonyuensis]